MRSLLTYNTHGRKAIIIGTGWYPVKLRAIHPGPVTLLNDFTRCILSIRMLKSSPAPQTVAREARDMRERRDMDGLDFPTSSRSCHQSRVFRAEIPRGRVLLSQTVGPLDFRQVGIAVPHLLIKPRETLS